MTIEPTPEHPYPRVGVATLVMKDGKFLICLRSGNHDPDTWGLPGGKLDLGETLEECALREIAEEVGVKVKNLRFIAVTNDLFEATKLHYITVFIKAEWASGEAQILEPEKCKEWRWVSYDDLPDNLMLPLANLKKQYPSLNL